MIISTDTYLMSNCDEVTVIVNEGSAYSRWVELRIWDDYEGRGGGAALYTLEAVDRAIAMLNTAREEMIKHG